MNKSVFILAWAALTAGPALAADPAGIDWSKIPAKTVTLFYPGQSSYEWLRTDNHPGAKLVLDGNACAMCHTGKEKDKGDKLVKGGPLEPTPVKGKNGYVGLSVQAAYDDKNAYFRYQWKTNGKAGIEYPYYRFDGKEWKVYGGPRLDKAVQEGKQPPIYEDRLSMMIDDGKVPMFANQGCWLTCHEGERDLKTATKEEVAANAAMQAYKKEDVRKYLPATRANPSDWKTGKSPEEIAKIKAAGGFVDLIQWRAHRSNPVGMADDGYVLEWRNFDAGKKMFDSNLDKETKQPKFMFDAAKFGAKAVTADQVGKKDNFLTKGVNAVPFDPKAGWKEGDMLPRYVTTSEVAGSAGDNKATGNWKNGMWTVVMIRPLGLANDDDKALKAGGVYSVGFAVHDDNITTRGHFVSFVRTLGLGAKADIQAVKLR
ncbi:MAG: ethylbenzene dehydrogenase-related protein [Sulfuricaulis sp.]|nr:ethylbenzene dehydrogenase-related protein [Sulfuricaulis sp.]